MKRYIQILLIGLSLSSCNDSFLEKEIIERQVESTVFNNYNNFKTYMWNMYEVFTDNGAITRTIDSYSYSYRGDAWAGYLNYINVTAPNYYASQTATTFAGGSDYGANYFLYATGGWDFSYVRRVNIMLRNIDKSAMTDAEKKHWRSVGYFFRSFLYMELVSRFGDVPWIDKAINEDDPLVYGSRTPRTEVVDHLMDDLLFAEANINEKGDGPNTINKACVQVLISRLGLFEGTWRKYHGVAENGVKYDRIKLLTESVRVSEALMATYPTLLSNYDALLNSESLSGGTNNGVILYKEYTNSIIMHYMARYCRTSEIRFDVPKHTIELYLTKNGLPIANAANQKASGGQYCGDKTMYDEFRDRDNRLLLSVVPPYYANTAYKYTPPAEFNVDVNEYKNKLVQLLPDATSKRLPVANYAGTVITQVPNVVGPGQAPVRSYTGYSTFRLYNLWEYSSASSFCNTADKPIFHMGEILLNYAEAQWELGKFTQAAADASINKLRARVGTASMNVGNIDGNFDPARDQSVDPVLWEIRRERIIELLGEGFGFDDIRRWKKAPWFINRNVTGCYIRYADYKASNGTIPAAWQNVALVDKNFNDVPKTPAGEGYIKRFVNQTTLGKGWVDKYYLLPLPLNDLALNPNLKQNPGW